MTNALEHWMAGYIAAWASNEAAAIAALFTDSAEYRFSPWQTPAQGHEQIVARWLASADSADDHRFAWHRIGGDGSRHFVQGRTEYTDGRTYENLWIIDLAADGRATSFIEWYMESAPKELDPGA